MTRQQMDQLETLVGSWRIAADFQRRQGEGRPAGFETAAHELENLIKQWKADAREKRKRIRPICS